MLQYKSISKDGQKQTTPVAFEPAMARPIATCIEAIATNWFGNKNHAASKSETSTESHPNTPEVLRSFAEQFGIGLEFVHRNAISLLPMRYPCIFVLKDGAGAIATNSTRNTVTIYVEGRLISVSKHSLNDQTETLVIAPTLHAQDPVSKPTAPIDVSKNKPTSTAAMAWLFSEIVKDQKSTIMLMLGAGLISNMLMIALPLFIMSVYDRVIPHNAMETLWALSIGVLIALGIDLGVRHVRLKLADSAGIATSVRIQTRLLNVLTQAKLQAVPRNTSAWTNTFRDIDTATSLAPAIISAVIVDIPFVALVLLLIYSIAGPTVMAPVAGITIFGIWTFIVQFKLAKNGEREALYQNEKLETLNEAASHIKTIKSANNQKVRLAFFERLLDSSISSTHALRQQSNMQPQTTMIMVQTVIVLSIILGVYQISSGSMTIGALAATTLLVGRVLLPAGNVLMLSAKFSQISNAIVRIHNLLQLPQENMNSHPEQNQIVAGEIELRNISFSFEHSASNILSDISLKITPGEKVAIIGKSGSGKSTLMQLLCRLYEPTMGSFLIDQFDSRQYSHAAVRQNIAYMPQDTDLFDASIYDNLKVNNPDPTHNEILNSLEVSGASEFIKSIPEGLSFEVGRQGEKLSGGERQSIALARTLLSSSNTLLLDEPTSSLDNTTEAKVLSGIKNSLGTKTLVISTHRANVLSLVDRIIWMDKGRIIADGPRDKILAQLKTSG